MNKFYHILWGVFAFFIVLFITGELIFRDGPSVFAALLICIVYSLIPDLDLKNSWIKQQFNRIVLYLIIMCAIVYLLTGLGTMLLIIVVLVIIEFILLVIKHRTILHSPIVGILLAVPLIFISYPDISYFVGGLVGILSHWIVDSFSKKK